MRYLILGVYLASFAFLIIFIRKHFAENEQIKRTGRFLQTEGNTLHEIIKIGNWETEYVRPNGDALMELYSALSKYGGKIVDPADMDVAGQDPSKF